MEGTCRYRNTTTLTHTVHMYSPSSADSARGRCHGAMVSCLCRLVGGHEILKPRRQRRCGHFIRKLIFLDHIYLSLESTLLEDLVFLDQVELWRSFLNDSQRSSRRSTVRGRGGEVMDGVYTYSGTLLMDNSE